MTRLLNVLALVFCVATYAQAEFRITDEQINVEESLRIDGCKTQATNLCHLNSNLLKDFNVYKMCWRSSMEECLAAKVIDCVSQEVTRATNVCLGEVCENVKFLMEECISDTDGEISYIE